MGRGEMRWDGSQAIAYVARTEARFSASLPACGSSATTPAYTPRMPVRRRSDGAAMCCHFEVRKMTVLALAPLCCGHPLFFSACLACCSHFQASAQVTLAS